LSDQESRHELPALPIVVDQRAGRPNGTWFGRLWRQTEGLLGSILDLLCLDLAVPEPVRASAATHTTFSCRGAGLGIAAALRKVDGFVHVVIDSTGLKVFGIGEWQLEKHGGKPRRSWRKLHRAVDPDSGEILASELTTMDDGDPSLVGPLLAQIDRPLAMDDFAELDALNSPVAPGRSRSGGKSRVSGRLHVSRPGPFDLPRTLDPN